MTRSSFSCASSMTADPDTTNMMSRSIVTPTAHSQYRASPSTQNEMIQGTMPSDICAIGQSTTIWPSRQTRPASNRTATYATAKARAWFS